MNIISTKWYGWWFNTKRKWRTRNNIWLGYEDELGFICPLYNDFEIEKIFNSLIENRFFLTWGEEGIDKEH